MQVTNTGASNAIAVERHRRVGLEPGRDREQLVALDPCDRVAVLRLERFDRAAVRGLQRIENFCRHRRYAFARSLTR
jgi:hypothetical protein